MSTSRQPGVDQQPLLHEAQRARILTTLVGNLAHDLNNLLTVITCNSDLLLGDPPKADQDSEHRAMLLEMAEAARQAGELTTALQSFSHRPSMSPGRCRLGETLAEMGRLLRHALPDDVELSIECPEDLPDVWADTGQLQHALMILCVRAGLAMTNGGRLRLTASKRQVEADTSLNARAIGEHVVLSVEHSGPRLTELFDDPSSDASPTDETGAAAGESPDLLGLGVVRDIVQWHDGWIDAADTAGDSHRYDLYWPVAAVEADRPAAEPPTDGGAVLVMDADPMARAIICCAVEKGGYHPIAAPDPESARRLVAQHADRLRIAIVRPEHQGGPAGALLAQIRKMEPAVAIVVLSQADAERDPTIAEPVVHLREPFGPREILEAVRQATHPDPTSLPTS
ncbi:MAG: hypothetical protein IH988_04740 [Planctomycetes bacterium]|nr:hypothetical protein [Planctomycetota bacterium]